MNRLALFAALLLTAAALFSSCADGALDADARSPDAEWIAEYGGPVEPLGPSISLGKSDHASGPSIGWESGDTVWAVSHQWTDVTNEAGIAWSADSGLTWEEKFEAWTQSLRTIERYAGGTTFEVTTPYGVTLPAPYLECAEVAIFLRVAFASWYELPFFLEASNGGQPVYLGHFGFRNADGSRFSNTPHFRSRYTDYTDSWDGSGDWPSDSGLRQRGLYGGGDEVPFLPDVAGEPARAGAYFDALFLNKRVGHFMFLALGWFGSMHLADEGNMMPIVPSATRAGDVLLHRWQANGIGHTLPVTRVSHPVDGRLEVALASGSMPRRQPVWEEGASVRWYFTSDYAGGPGENLEGEAYASLGGGIRRWRVATPTDSIYVNSSQSNAGVALSAGDLEAIADRPAEFADILQSVSPTEMRDAALARIEAARQHLAQYPASCAARERREEGFDTLYDVMSEHFGLDRGQVDARYRQLEDYVFAELEYTLSRTCCWNSSTANMYDILIEYAEAEQNAAAAAGECLQPTVFMGRNRGAAGDGYQIYASYAASLGRASDWVAWSDDEPCPQANVVNDIEHPHAWTPWCDIPEVIDDGGDLPPSNDDNSDSTIYVPPNCYDCSASSTDGTGKQLVFMGLFALFVVARRRGVSEHDRPGRARR